MIDPLLDKAKELSRKQGCVSVSYIQRMMRVGYTRASRLVDLMIEQEFCEKEYAEGKGYRALKICPTPRVLDGLTCPHCGSELLENYACPRSCPREFARQ